MSGEQIRLQVPQNCSDRANDQAVNSRVLVRRQKMHGIGDSELGVNGFAFCQIVFDKDLSVCLSTVCPGKKDNKMFL